MVTLNDYAPQGQSLQMGSAEEGVELIKSLQAGQITGRDTTNQTLGFEPLKPESLEKTLKNLDYRAEDIKLYNVIPKLTAYNTVEEYVQYKSFGGQTNFFVGEGQNGVITDPQFTRRDQKIKYMVTDGAVTLQAQMMQSYFGDAMTIAVKARMMDLLRGVDRQLTQANAGIVPEEFNSLYAQHAAVDPTGALFYLTNEAYYNSGTVIDLRGKNLKQANVEDGALAVDANFGNVSDIFAPSNVHSNLTKDYYATSRIIQDGKGFQGAIGTGSLKALDTSFGMVNMNSDKFMGSRPSKNSTTPAINNAGAPTAPTTVTTALVTTAISKYTTPEAGNVFYAVSAINASGESVLTINATAVALIAGRSVDITITPAASANPIAGYEIYRTLPTAAVVATGLEFYPIFKVSAAQVTVGYDGGAAGVVRDNGYYMANTEQAFLTDMSEEVLCLKQLAPISKLDLAVTTLAKRFSVFTFLTPILFAPKKMIRYINIGKTFAA